MRTYPRMSALLMTIALLSMVSWTAAQETSTSPADGHHADCVVRIACDTTALPVNEDMLTILLQSTVVINEPLQKLLGPNADTDRVQVRFHLIDEQVSTHHRSGVVPTTRHAIVGSVSVVIVDEQAKPVAGELLAALCTRLEQALQQTAGADEDRLHEHLAQVQAELERADQEFAELRAVEQELTKQAGRSTLSRESIEITIREMEDRKRAVELDLAAGKAREGALSRQIAEIGAQVEDQLAKSEFAKQLQRVVELREVSLNRMKQLVDSGQANMHDLAEAEQQLAMARAQLAQYREDASENAGGGMLANLNMQLTQLGIETAENAARLGYVASSLNELHERNVLGLADQYERQVRLRAQLIEQSVVELTQMQFELQRQVRNLRRPEVVIIGGEKK